MMIVKPPPHLTDKDLPDSDGLPVDNMFELPQSELLTIAVAPVLDRIYGEGRYVVAAASGIYWKMATPPLDGCKAPDWFFVPDVNATNEDGSYRRSYVLWNERVPPAIVVEYVSGDGAEEHDRTPETGKFWVYERAICAEVYVIFNPENDDQLEVYERRQGRFRPMVPNGRGHYEFPQMEVELGLWEGPYRGLTRRWMRFFDRFGKLLPNDTELFAQRNAQRKRADEAEARAEALAAELAALKQQLQNKATPPDVGPGANS